MFNLSTADLSGRILDCAGGPSSFNAESNELGCNVVSCDPLYKFTAEEIRARIDATYETMISNARTARNEFVWCEFHSPEHLGEIRMKAMRRFLADFPQGFREGRYVVDELPNLDFDDGQFDLALCSHFLFTYSDQLSTAFHIAAIREICRVAREARIFPLLKSFGGPSPKLEPVINALRKAGYQTEIRKVPYEFQRGGDEMLSVTRWQ